MENLCNRKPFLLWCIALDVNKYKCGPWTPIVTGIPNLQDVVHGLCKRPAFAQHCILLGISSQNVILIVGADNLMLAEILYGSVPSFSRPC